jgi:hypothetical protein
MTTWAGVGGAANLYSRYTTWTRVKTQLGISDSNDDTLLANAVESACALIDMVSGRRFVITRETKRFRCANSIHLGLGVQDLLALISITNGDGAAIDTSDVLAHPFDAYPKVWLEPVPGQALFLNGDYGYIEIVGLWGYHDNPAGAWTALTTLSAALTAAATSLTVPASIAGQELLQIDDEQLYVSSVTTGETRTGTVVRGANGTTAAAHSEDAAVTLYAPPAAIVKAADTLAAWLYRRPDAPFEKTAMPGLGQVIIPSELPADVANILRHFQRQSFI